MNNFIIVLMFGAIAGVHCFLKLDGAPCKKYQPECFTKIANQIYKVGIAGDAELNVQPLDPMFLDFVEGNLATLNYKLYNTTIKGFDKCTLNNTVLSDDETNLLFDLVCPVVTMAGQYETKGELLSLRVEGKGDYRLESKNYFVTFDSQVRRNKGNNGKEFMSYKSFKTDGQPEGGKFKFDNLLNGNKELSDTFHKFVNDNYKDVSKELQGPIFTVISTKIVKNMNKVLKTIPIDSYYVN